MKKAATKNKQAGQRAKTRGAAKRVRIKASEAFRPREVELMRDLYENEFWSVDRLAEKFETTVARVDSLVKYKTHR